MEPRAIVAEYDKASGRYTVTVGSQGVHGMRDAMCKVLKVDPEDDARADPRCRRRLRHEGLQLSRIPADGEGGEGARPAGEMGVATAASISSPTRTAATTSRPAPLALDADGRILALRVEFTANMGSYFNQFGAFIPWLAIS